MTFRKITSVACTFVLAIVAVPFASASVVVSGDHYDFSYIQQSSTRGSTDTPYGSYAAAGDTLNFTPSSTFKASSTDGGGLDFLDGTLVMLINATGGQGISQISADESGTFTLTPPATGSGSAATDVGVGSAITLQILSVDNQDITPILVQSSGVFSPDSAFDLVHNAGSNQTWTGSNTIDLTAGLRAHGITHGEATTVLFAIDNSLLASSETGTTASIEKNTFSITPTPEPTTLAMLALGSIALLLRRRKTAMA